MEHNYIFIDDIINLTGKVPAEEDYGMQYRHTRKKEGRLEYLGTKLIWSKNKKGEDTFQTEMLEREEMYPHPDPQIP